MRDFIGKNSVNKVYISAPNCHTGNKYKIEGFVFKSCLYSSLFAIIFSIHFQKNLVVGENRKDLHFLERNLSQHHTKQQNVSANRFIYILNFGLFRLFWIFFSF